MTSESKRTRRQYGERFKAMVLAECEDPGKSVAQVAMAHGINDNVVHRWRQLARQQHSALPATVGVPPSAEQAMAFVPLALPGPDTPETKTEVRLDIKRGAVTVGVAWPENALSELASFVRELLK